MGICGCIGMMIDLYMKIGQKRSAGGIDSHSRGITSNNPIFIFDMENFFNLIVNNPFISRPVLWINSINSHDTPFSQPNHHLRVFFVLLQEYTFGETIQKYFLECLQLF